MADHVDAALDKYAAFASKLQAYGSIPASVTLAQLGEESSWARNAPGNNLFGIKADKSWKGKVQMLPTKEEVNGVEVSVLAPFRVYDNPLQSMYDHALFLQENERYQKAGVFASSDPYEVASKLQQAGYATNSSYASNLNDIIKGRNLTQYDVKQVSSTLPSYEEMLKDTPSLKDVWDVTTNIVGNPGAVMENAPTLVEGTLLGKARPMLINISTWALIAGIIIVIIVVLFVLLVRSPAGKAAVNVVPQGKALTALKTARKVVK